MAKYPIMYEDEDGWCEWIVPKKGYKLACCDCSLVHALQFRIVRVGKNRGDFVEVEEIVNEKGLRVAFRASRDKRATAAARRRKKCKK